jgi:hypothetical protein
MELQMLSLLGELRAGGDWAAIAAEHWANQPPSTLLGPGGRRLLRAARQLTGPQPARTSQTRHPPHRTDRPVHGIRPDRHPNTTGVPQWPT